MRREEFRESMNYIDDLFDFAQEHDLECYYDVICGSDLDDAICEDLRDGDVTRHLTWGRIRDALDEIVEGCDYYIRGTDWLEFDELCYEDYYEMIVEEMDANDLWDDEDEEEEDEYDEEEEDEDEETGEEFFFSFDDFASGVKDEVTSIREKLIREEAERREAEQRNLMEAQRLIDEAASLASKEETERIAMLGSLLAS